MTSNTSLIPMLAAAILLITPHSVPAHPDKGEKLPQSYAEAWIAMTPEDLKLKIKGKGAYRHPPGNVRAEDMRELFNNRVMLADAAREFSRIGAPDHALKVIFFGRDGRYAWCSYGEGVKYFFADHVWAPVKVKHDGQLFHRLDGHIHNDNHDGHSPLYDGATGQLVMYARGGPRKTWVDWNVGHLQERLPRAVWTLCPDFPSAEELGVGVNEAQTAITYDRLIEQDPGRRVLRPDLITPDPTEVIE